MFNKFITNLFAFLGALLIGFLGEFMRYVWTTAEKNEREQLNKAREAEDEAFKAGFDSGWDGRDWERRMDVDWRNTVKVKPTDDPMNNVNRQVTIRLRSGHYRFLIQSWSGQRYCLVPVKNPGDVELWLTPSELLEHGSNMY